MVTSAPFSKVDWAKDFLAGLGAPVTRENVAAIVAWEQQEGGHVHNDATWNPLNTTQPAAGAVPMSPKNPGIKAYPDRATGLAASIETIRLGGRGYEPILAALAKGNDAAAVIAAIGASKWGTHLKGLQATLPIGYREADAAGIASPVAGRPAPVVQPAAAMPHPQVAFSRPALRSVVGTRVFIDIDDLKDLAGKLRLHSGELHTVSSEVDHLLRGALQWYPQFAMHQARGQSLAHRLGHVAAQVGDHGRDVAKYADSVLRDQQDQVRPFPTKHHWGPFPLPKPSIHFHWPNWQLPVVPMPLPGWVRRLEPWRHGPPEVAPPGLGPTPATQPPSTEVGTGGRPGDPSGVLPPSGSSPGDAGRPRFEWTTTGPPPVKTWAEDCSGYAAWRRKQLGLSVPDELAGHANGGDWGRLPGAHPLVRPTLGAAVSSPQPPPYGHVMIVEEVSADGTRMRVSDNNGDGLHHYTERWYVKSDDKWRLESVWDNNFGHTSWRTDFKPEDKAPRSLMVLP
jgi:hypothetical protein